MKQIEWLHKLANIRYLTDKQFDVLSNNQYVKEICLFGDYDNCTEYLIRITDEGWNAGFLDYSFLTSVVKDGFICECKGVFEYIENQAESYESALYRCNKCGVEIEKCK